MVFFSCANFSGFHALSRALPYQFQRSKVLSGVYMVFYFSPCRYFGYLLRLGCFFTSSRGLYGLVSVLACSFDPRFTFIGQGIHMFLRTCLFGLPGYRTNTHLRTNGDKR